jgi:xylan 1,4-beta-xylosidase
VGHPPPTTPFHGGFGLLNREGVRKSAYFACKYLHALQGNEVPVQDPQVFAASRDGNVSAVIWDFQQPQQNVSTRPFFSRIVPATKAPTLDVKVTHLTLGSYRLRVHRTGFRANDPYSAYIDIGAPKELTPSQLGQLRLVTRDLPETDRVVQVGKDGIYSCLLPMRSNDVVLVTLEKVNSHASTGTN